MSVNILLTINQSISGGFSSKSWPTPGDDVEYMGNACLQISIDLQIGRGGGEIYSWLSIYTSTQLHIEMYTLYNILVLSYSQRTGICRQLMGGSRKYAYQIFKLYNLNMLHSRKNHTYWIQIFTGCVSTVYRSFTCGRCGCSLEMWCGSKHKILIWHMYGAS